jgi:hypothetical protein
VYGLSGAAAAANGAAAAEAGRMDRKVRRRIGYPSARSICY